MVRSGSAHVSVPSLAMKDVCVLSLTISTLTATLRTGPIQLLLLIAPQPSYLNASLRLILTKLCTGSFRSTVQVALAAAAVVGCLQRLTVHCSAARGRLLPRERPWWLRRRHPRAQAQVRLWPLARRLAGLHPIHEAQPRALLSTLRTMMPGFEESPCAVSNIIADATDLRRCAWDAV